MPTRVEILHTRERADRALRAGRPREALAHYWQLLESVKATRAHYDSWLDGAVGAYLALNRTREAGYVLLGLRRYAEAQRHFPAAERPLEWALCAAKLGHHGDAARVLSESGRPVLAALELEAAGASAAARLEWERVLADPRLAGRPYETALGALQSGRGAACASAIGSGAARAFAEAQRLLETAADDFETRGEPVRAFDCYSVLLRLGKATDSFENVSEGYLNAIRVLAAEDQLLAMQYYDDFLTYAIDRREWHAAAMAAREAANYSLRAGKPYDRHYLGRRRRGLDPRRARQPDQRRPGRSVGQRASRRHRCGHGARGSGVVRPPLRRDGRAPARSRSGECAIARWPSATRRCRRRCARRRSASPSTSAAPTSTATSGDRT